MIVTNTPAKDLAYTNCAYCSPADLRNFLVPGSKLAYALIADAFVLTLAMPFLMVILVLMRFKDAMPKFPLETLYLLTDLFHRMTSTLLCLPLTWSL